MSWQASHWAKKSRGHKTITDKAVLLILAEYANPETWEAYPSQKALAEDLECSKRTIQRSLDSLERGGFITQVQEGNQHQYSVYRLNGPLQVSPAQVRAGVCDNLSHATLVTGVCDTGDARTVKEPEDDDFSSPKKRSSSSANVELDEQLISYLLLYSNLPSGILSPVTKPLTYFQEVARNGNVIPPFDPDVVLRAAVLVQRALNQDIEFPRPRDAAGLAAVLEILETHPKLAGTSPRHLGSCVEVALCYDGHEEGSELNPATVLTRLAQQPEALRLAVDSGE